MVAGVCEIAEGLVQENGLDWYIDREGTGRQVDDLVARDELWNREAIDAAGIGTERGIAAIKPTAWG
jgi:hypothetical protein